MGVETVQILQKYGNIGRSEAQFGQKKMRIGEKISYLLRVRSSVSIDNL